MTSIFPHAGLEDRVLNAAQLIDFVKVTTNI